MDALFGGGIAGGGSGGGANGGQSAASGAAAAAAAAANAAAAAASPPLIASASGHNAAAGHHHQHSLYSSSSASGAAASLEAANYLVNPAHFNGHDNGPILYADPNRTSAIDDIRSVVIYIFIATIFSSFFLILPGIRSEKLPTFFCVTTSLLVGSIIVLSLFGTTWHVGEAPISAAYKAFSRDRIQGDLSVRMGLQSVNISLKAHKYYILHHADGPMIMENLAAADMLASMAAADGGARQQAAAAAAAAPSSAQASGRPAESEFVEYSATSDQATSAAAASFIAPPAAATEAAGAPGPNGSSSLADELARGRTADGIPVDTELETEEVFSDATSAGRQARNKRQHDSEATTSGGGKPRKRRQRFENETRSQQQQQQGQTQPLLVPKYTVKRVHVDINYNERFYWIGPVQMRHEYHQALERGLPYPILTVVEYLAQDDAGFNWSRRYRAAGYYTSMCLWLSASLCALMFCLHCAAPKYGLYAMQLLGCLLLCTNLTYALLVPRGDQKLVIPFEGQSLTFRFGWNFWLVLVGGCLALSVGTINVILDSLIPNFIFTTVLDANYDSQQSYYQRKHKTILHADRAAAASGEPDDTDASASASPAPAGRRHEKPKLPPFMKMRKARSSGSSTSTRGSGPDASINNDNLSQKSQAPLTTTLAERKQMGLSEGAENGRSLAAAASGSGGRPAGPTSENHKRHSGGETLVRRRSEHQQAAAASSNGAQAIDHRDMDSREARGELTIRL